MHRVDWTARRLPELITAQARMDFARSVYCKAERSKTVGYSRRAPGAETTRRVHEANAKGS